MVINRYLEDWSVLLSVFSLVVITAAVLSISSHTRASEPILIVTETWPPYVFEEDGQAKGFDWDVSRRIFQQMGYEPELRFLPWKKAVDMVVSGQAAALLDVKITPERELSMRFPETHLSSAESTLFAFSSEPFLYEGLNSLSGLRVGVQSGYVYSRAFTDSVLFKRVPAGSMEENFQMLLSGDVDLVMANRMVGLYVLKTLGIKGVSASRASVTQGKVYIAFSRAHPFVEQVDEFDQRLAHFKQTQAYRAIMNFYLVRKGGAGAR